ncbi:MAG TPA: hypothetical protein VEW66_05885 [Thermomicrobiales bacterium]|nr:hypothetical protein [Thermomicrobiales bacterium]
MRDHGRQDRHNYAGKRCWWNLVTDSDILINCSIGGLIIAMLGVVICRG